MPKGRRLGVRGGASCSGEGFPDTIGAHAKRALQPIVVGIGKARVERRADLDCARLDAAWASGTWASNEEMRDGSGPSHGSFSAHGWEKTAPLSSAKAKRRQAARSPKAGATPSLHLRPSSRARLEISPTLPRPDHHLAHLPDLLLIAPARRSISLQLLDERQQIRHRLHLQPGFETLGHETQAG